MGSETKTVTSSQNTAPWAAQQGYLLNGFQSAQNIYENAQKGLNSNYFPDATYVPMSDASAAGIRTMYDRGVQGGAYNGVAGNRAAGAIGADLINMGASGLEGYGTLANTAAGGALNANPYQSQIVQQAVQAARVPIDSSFAGSGRLGSGAYANAMADSANRIGAQIGYQGYDAERQRQLAAAQQLGQNDMSAMGLGGQLAGQAAGFDQQNVANMLGGGQLTEGYQNQVLQDQINRWNYAQNREKSILSDYMGMVQGNYGGSSTSTQPVVSNPALQGISAATGLLGAAGMAAAPFTGGASLLGALPALAGRGLMKG